MPTKKELLNRILSELDNIYSLNQLILTNAQTGGQNSMATLAELKTKLDDLSAKVATDTAVKSSASTLMDGLAEILRNIKTDPAAIDALASQIDSTNAAVDSSNAALAAAVERNTPAVAP